MSAIKITRKTILDTDIYCLTAEKFSLGRSNLEVIKAMLDNGIKLVQYREKEKKMGLKYQECLEIRKMTRDAGAAFIINDDIDLAILVEADGVHIGQEDFPIEAVRKLVGNDMAIGLSTHSPEQARNALKRGADYIGVGPVFRTFTKDDVCDPVGFEYLEYVVENIDIPFVAIGGIKENNVAEVVRHGARCVALVTEIVEADNIGNKINALRDAMLSAAES
ncbi:thiamine phosphate synthase [Maridesulfovibrio ferrireducens]|uniref:thiamine phosphate synthase n=1 Tax=Maridesulfovibrio ferrireducens TaxID=246191 RepID=UPI001A2619CA|nr:thiamine phosphate synthase [Maridesulfovibrio ferrireducens]MBI9111943.1 thiamine phosphate synthase [Maridesulfovibrio ferrireducens]